MAEYGHRPDYYCDMCRGDIWTSKKNFTIVKEGRKPENDAEYVVHTVCIYPAISLVLAVRGVADRNRY